MNESIFIKRLISQEKYKYEKHLLELPPQDQFMRFGGHIKDSLIQKYVEDIDFWKDGVFGAFNADLQLVGVVHTYLYQEEGNGRKTEIAISVDTSYRQKHIGKKLIRRALNWCQNNFIDEIEMYWMADNQGINKIAKEFDYEISQAYQEKEGVLKMTAPNMQSVVNEVIEESVGWIDYTILRSRKTRKNLEKRLFKM